MYTPRHFTMPPELQERILAAPGVGDLITHGPSGLLATHLPYLFDADMGEQGSLVLHVARPNAQWREPASGESLFIVTPATDGSSWLDPLRAPIYNDVVGNRESRKLDDVVLQFSHRFGEVEFRSTTDWRQFNTENREDEDGTNRLATYFDTANVEHNANWYQEFKLSGRNARTDWVAGVSYSSEHAQQHSDTDLYTDGADTVLSNLGLAPPGGLFGPTGDGLTAAHVPSRGSTRRCVPEEWNATGSGTRPSRYGPVVNPETAASAPPKHLVLVLAGLSAGDRVSLAPIQAGIQLKQAK